MHHRRDLAHGQTASAESSVIIELIKEAINTQLESGVFGRASIFRDQAWDANVIDLLDIGQLAQRARQSALLIWILFDKICHKDSNPDNMVKQFQKFLLLSVVAILRDNRVDFYQTIMKEIYGGMISIVQRVVARGFEHLNDLLNEILKEVFPYGDVVKSTVWPLWVDEYYQSTISGFCQVLSALNESLGIPPTDEKIAPRLSVGDELTYSRHAGVKSIWSDEPTLAGTFKHFKPVPGIFHLMHMMIRTSFRMFWGATAFANTSTYYFNLANTKA
ncbi:hypothetical protein HDU93_004410 [Gonapodya sp. JEL0774]|nr:hypothetical protein HDU93_004410 [Gonapodya sp. JEL0774]